MFHKSLDIWHKYSPLQWQGLAGKVRSVLKCRFESSALCSEQRSFSYVIARWRCGAVGGLTSAQRRPTYVMRPWPADQTPTLGDVSPMFACYLGSLFITYKSFLYENLSKLPFTPHVSKRGTISLGDLQRASIGLPTLARRWLNCALKPRWSDFRRRPNVGPTKTADGVLADQSRRRPDGCLLSGYDRIFLPFLSGILAKIRLAKREPICRDFRSVCYSGQPWLRNLSPSHLLQRGLWRDSDIKNRA